MVLQQLVAEVVEAVLLLKLVVMVVQVSSSLLTQSLEPLKKLTTQHPASNGGVL